MQVVLDIEFGVFLQKLGPMKVAGSLTSIDENLGVSGTVYNHKYKHLENKTLSVSSPWPGN